MQYLSLFPPLLLFCSSTHTYTHYIYTMNTSDTCMVQHAVSMQQQKFYVHPYTLLNSNQQWWSCIWVEQLMWSRVSNFLCLCLRFCHRLLSLLFVVFSSCPQQRILGGFGNIKSTLFFNPHLNLYFNLNSTNIIKMKLE